MGLYNDLTAEEKADIARYDTFIRGSLSSIISIAKLADLPAWEAFAFANVAGPLASLDAGEIIPNSTGLGGAKDLTKEEFIALQSRVRAVLERAEGLEAALVKAIGVNS